MLEKEQVAFIRGCYTTIFAFSLTGLFVGIFMTPDEPTDVSKFKVIDQYQGCDVVKYTDPSSGWNYFLKCK